MDNYRHPIAGIQTATSQLTSFSWKGLGYGLATALFCGLFSQTAAAVFYMESYDENGNDVRAEVYEWESDRRRVAEHNANIFVYLYIQSIRQDGDYHHEYETINPECRDWWATPCEQPKFVNIFGQIFGDSTQFTGSIRQSCGGDVISGNEALPLTGSEAAFAASTGFNTGYIHTYNSCSAGGDLSVKEAWEPRYDFRSATGKVKFIKVFSGSAFDVNGNPLVFDHVEPLVFSFVFPDTCTPDVRIDGTHVTATWYNERPAVDYPDPARCTFEVLAKAVYRPVSDGPDSDGDGFPDADDNCPYIANPRQNDFDQDGVGYACDTDFSYDPDSDGIVADNCAYWANPDQSNMDDDPWGDVCDVDRDNDGLYNTTPSNFIDPDIYKNGTGVGDNCPDIPNPDQADVDGDGIGDACDDDVDVDGDGVQDTIDNCPALANADQADSDSDSVGDVCDSCPLDAANDADDDGVCGDVDNCPIPNSDQLNLDGDIAGDACDICPLDAANDADGDGICGDVDNCPSVANPDQSDTDDDGFGDACNTGFDDDGDEWSNSRDNCPAVFNPDQANDDGDVLGNVCDVCPADATNDADGDGFCAGADNCPLISNSDQLDTDRDGKGNFCDGDIDGDNVSNILDNCPLAANAQQGDIDQDGIGDACDLDNDNDRVSDAVDQCADTSLAAVVNGDGCAIAQLCPSQGDWKNHGAYVRCVAKTAESFLADGLINEEEKSAEVSTAGKSDVGHK